MTLWPKPPREAKRAQAPLTRRRATRQWPTAPRPPDVVVPRLLHPFQPSPLAPGRTGAYGSDVQSSGASLRPRTHSPVYAPTDEQYVEERSRRGGVGGVAMTIVCSLRGNCPVPGEPQVGSR